MAQLEDLNMDSLLIYGFSFKFPASSRVEFHPKFERVKGDLAVKSATKSIVMVSWGSLEEVTRKLPTVEDHAEFSLSKIRKGVRTSLTNVEHKEIQSSGHQGVYNHVRVEVPGKGLFAKPEQKEVRSLHIHCPQTGRYFVIYSESNAAGSKEQGENTLQIMSSFRCHQ